MRLRTVSTIALLATGGFIACLSGTFGTELDDGGAFTGGATGTANGGTSASTTAGTGGSTAPIGGSTAATGGASGATGGGFSTGGSALPTAGSGAVSGGGSGGLGGSNEGGSGAVSTQGGFSGGGAAGMSGGDSGGTDQGGTGQGGGGPGQGGGFGKGGGMGQGGMTGQGGQMMGQGGNMSSGGSPPQPPQQCNQPQGNQGFTTRFWDCCKPSCSWAGNVGGRNPARACNQQNQTHGNRDAQSACSGGDSFACWDFSPWAVDDTLAYGFAAFNGGQCGQCYELRFTGQSNSQPDDPGSAGICHKRMIVQVVNIGGIQGNQFDIMIPGGGVGDFNACSRQWGVQDHQLGERYGGLMLACQKQNNELEARKSCTLNACNQLFGNNPQLLAGCKFQVEWLNAADNPRVTFQQVPCPGELTSKSGLN